MPNIKSAEKRVLIAKERNRQEQGGEVRAENEPEKIRYGGNRG